VSFIFLCLLTFSGSQLNFSASLHVFPLAFLCISDFPCPHPPYPLSGSLVPSLAGLSCSAEHNLPLLRAVCLRMLLHTGELNPSTSTGTSWKPLPLGCPSIFLYMRQSIPV
jgi:hypothetical protein